MSVSGASKILYSKQNPFLIKSCIQALSKIWFKSSISATTRCPEVMGGEQVSVDVVNEKLLRRENKPLGSDCASAISCTTFNILAPIYKRLNSESRESEFREYWLGRNESILDKLLLLKSSIICLQEFWIRNGELVGMYERRLGEAGYATFKLARTNNRGDGLLTAVKRNQFQVLNYKELLFNDFGDRVSQLLHIDLIVNFSQSQSTEIKKETLVVNTHLLFPHNAAYCLRRLLQVYKILRYIKSYCEEYRLPTVPIILCGDWNGSKRGHVYKFLRSQGFVSSYDIAHQYSDSDADAHKWISHRNHRGNVCGVDFIWLLNPTNARKSLTEGFIESLFGNIKSCISKESSETTGTPHTKFDLNYSNRITYSQFCQALIQTGLTSDPYDGISSEEMKDFWDCVDTDRDGVIDLSEFNEFQREQYTLPSTKASEEKNEEIKVQTEAPLNKSKVSTSIAFDVKKAVLFPPEVEKGVWPDNYSLSDHAHLTVEFAPVMIHSS